jgi:hypothetical protein
MCPKAFGPPALAAAIFSSGIFLSFCFLGFAQGLTLSLCSMMLLLTPIRSEVVQAKTSLFLSRNDSSSISSFGERSCATSTVLSGTHRSSVTHFVSHSTSIVVLPLLRASSFAAQMSC